MKNPEILNPLNNCGTAFETALMTTIHLINDSIFTDHQTEYDDDEIVVFGEPLFDV